MRKSKLLIALLTVALLLLLTCAVAMATEANEPTAIADSPIFSVYSGAPSPQTLIASYTDTNEIYSAVMSTNARYIEVHSNVIMTVPQAIPSLTHDMTIDLKGHKLTLTGTAQNYGINPANGVTFAIKNGTLESAKAHLAFPYNTDCHLVYEDLAVNYSGNNMMDHRGGGTITAKNTVFNITSSSGHAFYLINKTANRTLSASFEGCTFRAAAGCTLANGFFQTASESIATGTLNLVFSGCSFETANVNNYIFQQNGAAALNVTVKDNAGKASSFTTTAPIIKKTGTGAATIAVADGTTFASTPTYSGVTPSYPSGTKLVHGKSSAYTLTDDYVTVNKVNQGVTSPEYYEKGYAREVDTTFGYRLDTKNGVKGARQTIEGAFLDENGQPIEIFTPTDGMTVTVYAGDTDVWANWVILNADESQILHCSFDNAYLGQSALPTGWNNSLIPQGGVMRLFADVVANESLVALPSGSTLDLGGNCLTFSAGRFAFTNDTFTGTVSFKNGKINSGSQNILYTTVGFKGTMRFTDVEFVNSATAFDFRGGYLYLDGCSYSNSSKTFINLGNRFVSTAPIRVYFTDCNLNANVLISSTGYNNTEQNPDAEVTLSGCELTGSTFFSSTNFIGEEAKYSFTISDCKVNVTNMYDLRLESTVSLTIGSSLFSVDPRVSTSTYGPDSISYIDGQGVISNDDPVYRYAVKIPVDLSWNLTLYTDIKINLYLGGETIESVNVNGKDFDLASLPKDESGQYILSLDSVPANRAMDDITITVGYGGGKSLTSTKTLIDYAKSLFASSNTYKSKQLVAATMRYIYSAYYYAHSLDSNEPEAPTALTDLLDSDIYLEYSTDRDLVLDGACDIGNTAKAIKSAQLDLSSNLMYRFNLAPTYSGMLTVNGATYSIANGTDTATGRSYIDLTIRAYALYRDHLTIGGVASDGTELSGAYCLGTYVNGVKDTASKETMIMLNALSTYVTLASEYRSELDDTQGYTPGAEIVNKNNTDAVVTYVIDDGNVETGEYGKEFLEKYDYLRLSFAMITKNLATLKTTTNEKGETVYEMTEDGKYVYTVNQSYYEKWLNIMSTGRSEIINHTHTHAYWGINDDGGKTTYVDNNGNVRTSTQPKGSSTKELLAPIQIISELFPTLNYPLNRMVGFINAGISVPMSDKTVNGVTYTSYYNYFKQLLLSAIEDGTLIGTRTTFQVNNTTGSASYVVLPSRLANKANRLDTPGYMILDKNKGANGIENWTAYIDHAIAQGGWACFCIHEIRPVAPSSGHYILKTDADKLFGYTRDKNVWVATYSEAMTYYCQWSTAEVSSEYRDGKVLVTLTDKEDDELFNMAMTVKVSVPPTWSTASHNGTALTVYENEDGTHYVLVDLVPDQGTAEITKGN